jgi:hypothetical protein
MSMPLSTQQDDIDTPLNFWVGSLYSDSHFDFHFSIRFFPFLAGIRFFFSLGVYSAPLLCLRVCVYVHMVSGLSDKFLRL